MKWLIWGRLPKQQLARSFTRRNVVRFRACEVGLMKPVAFTVFPFHRVTSSGSFILSLYSTAPSHWNASASAAAGGAGGFGQPVVSNVQPPSRRSIHQTRFMGFLSYDEGLSPSAMSVR